MQSKAFHLVMIQPVRQHRAFTGLKIQVFEQGLFAVATHKNHAGPIWSHQGPNSTAISTHLCTQVTGFSVQAHHTPKAAEWVVIVAKATRTGGKPQMPTIGGHFAGMGVIIFGGQGKTRAAIEMVLP